MIYLVVCVCVLAQGVKMSSMRTANSTCHNANWWSSFDHLGWSKCPEFSPYINGLMRSRAPSPGQDWIFNLEEANCCDNGAVNAVCVPVDWNSSFKRKNNMNSCPPGYYLSGLYRLGTEQGLLIDIKYAWCCKPGGAPDTYKMCYDEDVSLSFDWNKKGMVSCGRSGYYITGLYYKSACYHLYCIEKFRCCEIQAPERNTVCHNADWWSSFDYEGWSKCPESSPYINGLWRSKAQSGRQDWISLLELANCCDNGTVNAVCVQADWNTSLDKKYYMNSCPSGYYLSGLYRSKKEEGLLYNIEYAWCCKPSGAPDTYKTCYDEDVSLNFDWYMNGMVSCGRSGYYITGLYESDCNYLHCIENFRCCELQAGESCSPTDARKTVHVNAVPNNRSVKFIWTYDANPEDTGFSLSISGGYPAKKMNITMREYIFPGLEPNKTYNYSYTIFYGKGCKIIAATDTFTTSPEYLKQVSNSDKPGGKSEEKSLNIGAVIGGVTGGIIFLIVILFFVRKIIIRKQHERSVREFNAMRHLDNPRQNNYNLVPQKPPIKHEADSENNKDFPEEISYIVLLENWDIPPDNLKVLDKKLGGGQFGIVKQGLLTTGKGDPEVVAVKTVKENAKECDLQDLMTELTILKEVNKEPHPNVIRLVGGCSIKGKLHVIVEFCPGGNLRQFLINSRISSSEENVTKYINLTSTLNHRQLLKLALDIANGMDHLSSQKFIHRDLAARNILIGEDNIAKVSDFGLARDVGGAEEYIKNNQNLLPVKWMALESLLDGRFTTASDVWSYGILLYEIATLGEEPYKKISPYNIIVHIGSGCRMSKPRQCSDEIYEVMTKCWKIEPKERPTFKQICETLNDMLKDEKKSYINVTQVLNEESLNGTPETENLISEEKSAIN